MISNRVSLKGMIGPAYYELHKLIKQNVITHFWLKGGRGSLKSSFIGIEIPLGIMRDASQGNMTNALIVRRVKDTLRDSVYEQIKWGIYMMHVEEDWYIPESKLQMIYKPTGQVILFKGADNPKKLKSTKVSIGYIKYLWYEECDEFESYDKIRNINQSILRGGPHFCVFYSFNPPESQRNWVNREVQTKRNDKIVLHTTYLQAPREWIGEQMLIEAEHLKEVNPSKYNHEYLGEVIGTGAEVFTNLTIRTIEDEEIENFDRLKFGLDFGYAGDPLAFVKMNFDKTRRRLFIFAEIYGLRISNRKAVTAIKLLNVLNKIVIADSAEPRTISEFKELGLNIRGAKKGPDSIENGIKWLQDLEEIIIDPIRCPNAAREFNDYELEKDKDGNLKGDYPDRDNHSIDAARYGLNDEILNAKARVKKGRSRLGI